MLLVNKLAALKDLLTLVVGKGKVHLGCLSAELVIQVTKFFMILEPSIETILLNCTLSQLHTDTLGWSTLTDTTDNRSE